VPEFRIDGTTLSAEVLMRIAEGGRAVLDPEARERMAANVAWYDTHPHVDVVRQKWAWIGASSEGQADIQAFVEGHCAGVGEPLPVPWVRALLAARANVLAVGLSGVRPEAAEVLVAFLEAGVTPVVPTKGAVGAAGSAALAHVARVVCGFGGEVFVDGERKPVASIRGRVPSLDPTEKEALALLNGSTLGTALGALAVARARRMLHAAEAACALSLEAVRADCGALSSLATEARRQPGAARSAKRLRELVDGSTLVQRGRRPDSFSIRCAPVVFGAAWDALDYVDGVVGRELNAAVDNPLVFDGQGVIEAGNFHGAPVALAMDHLKIALTQVASMSERRVYRLTYGDLSGLPSFLLPGSGVNSGLMLAQYTAASLVSECKGLSHPASVDNIPTVQHHEDHVSMAPIAARSALEVVEILSDVVAIELLAGAQALDFRTDDGGRAGSGSARIHAEVRDRVPRWVDDRFLHPDLEALGEGVRDGAFSAH
jgi:histidine ammonia-lyase